MLRKWLKQLTRRFGYDIVKYYGDPNDIFPSDFDDELKAIVKAVQPFTMTTKEKIFAMVEATKYVTRANIPGSIVECGVWRGGSMMAAAYALKNLGVTNRDLFLYDTYTGMVAPDALIDVSVVGESAVSMFKHLQTGDDTSAWCLASIEDARNNLYSTGYNPEKIHLIKGKVEDTIPSHMPDQISILRLDTDWYESTLHELVHLYPRLVVGGVLLTDDYGHWMGNRKAIDEYFAQHHIPILLHRIDYAGRAFIKMRDS